MSFFHLRTIPGNTWPPIPGNEISQLWAMYLELERTQWLDPAEIEQAQLAQVRTLLAHCVENVPYYREQWKATGMTVGDIKTMADFRRIPILQRRIYQEQFPNLLAQKLPAGTKHTTKLRTSGTSGMPIQVLQTNLVNLWWFAFHLRDFQWCDFDPRGTVAAIRTITTTDVDRRLVMEGVELPYWGEQLHQVVENGLAYAMDIDQEPRRQLDWLRRVQPNYVISYPPNLEYLASLLQEAGERLPGLRAIQTIAETLTDETRQRIEEGFGVPVRNTYSCVEAGYLASPCPAGHGLHVHAENVLFELLDEADQPCGPGETGRVVLTTLHNFLAPFIRYEILDGATLGAGRCPCGRGLPLLTQVLGKRRHQFRLPGGRRKDSGFLVRQMRKLGGYRQHQIIQRALDHVVVRLVPDREWSPEHPARVVKWVQEYFEAPVRVTVETVERLPMTPAGKIQDVQIDFSEDAE